ncbi:DUF2634 domain-containing protein [Gudongella oleilytica]|uniref:DUF2634 domain-containing protein n=1 Tax=Gudongella oleilytica TaxID=1582259 RepID=UPI002A35DEE3|nr:DUF2634 domain-containing protein [Gudongella oleilytica]MDY0256259.1 DUF2634 domain-containing protein [Gudongella oleilytica]
MALIPNAASVAIGQDVEVIEQKDQTSRTYKIDFSSGRVGGFIDETDAMKQAIIKILQSERFLYLIYSWNYGIEMNAIVGKSYQVIASEIKRIIREALLEDKRITDVYDITAEQIDKRTLSVRFTASTVFGEVTIETEVSANV